MDRDPEDAMFNRKRNRSPFEDSAHKTEGDTPRLRDGQQRRDQDQKLAEIMKRDFKDWPKSVAQNFVPEGLQKPLEGAVRDWCFPEGQKERHLHTQQIGKL